MLKVLHVSFHIGCHNDFMNIAKELELDLKFLEFTDGTPGKYNIGHERAEKYWNKHKEYFKQFDVIVTSDTSPISRVFLQNGWDKKLIIWINNRFDYHDAASLDCEFPDDEYYQLFKDAVDKPNVHIIGYTDFENHYCKEWRNIDIGNTIIKPIGKPTHIHDTGNFIELEDIQNTFFVGPYHNDNLMMDLPKKLKEMNLPIYNGRFNGPHDLARFKGVIHIPYSWSNYAFFEGLSLGIVYFIPTKEFLLELKKDKDFFWSPPYKDELIELSEWYHPDHKDLLVYFDSWLNLKIKLYTTNYKKQKNLLKEYSFNHSNKTLKQWENVFFN